MAGTYAGGLYSARPTISVNGHDDADLTRGLLAANIAESLSGVFHCTALFGNWGAASGTPGFLYFDRKILDFGVGFSVN